MGIEASVQPDLLVGHGRAAQVHCRNGDEALRIATVNGTHASYENALKGTITAGKLADFVQLAKDPHHVAPDTIKDIRVVRTIAGGRRRSHDVRGVVRPAIEP